MTRPLATASRRKAHSRRTERRERSGAELDVKSAGFVWQRAVGGLDEAMRKICSDLGVERATPHDLKTVRFWWNRFGPMFAAEIRKRRVAHMRGYPQWRWHLDEVFVKINGKLCYLWRAVDHEGEVLEAVATTKRDKAAALKRAMSR